MKTFILNLLKLVWPIWPFGKRKGNEWFPKYKAPPPPPERKVKIVRWQQAINLKQNDYVRTERGDEGYVICTKQDGRKCLVEFRHRSNKRFWFATHKLQKRID